MYWANFLHIYQPPTQRHSILRRVVGESYDRVLAELKKNPQAKVAMNVAGCLLDLLAENGYEMTIRDIRELMVRGQLELTLSAKYHPLLPKLPDSEVIRQIELDWETHKKYFGNDFCLSGFFPPEAAYTPHLAQIVAGLGFKWILAEELSYNGRLGMLRGDRVYEVLEEKKRIGELEDLRVGKAEGRDLPNSLILQSSSQPFFIFFREREASFKILSGQLGTCRLFEDYLGERLGKEEYLLTAMDGETFGHHRPGMEKLLFEIYKSRRFKTVTISELIGLFPEKEKVTTLPSTWALMEKDLEKNAPFSRWHDPDNPIHQKQWQLTDLALRAVNESKYAKEISNLKSQISKLNRKSQISPRSKISDADLTSDLCDLRSVNPGMAVLDREQEQWCLARKLLDKALHSDQYWWASARPWWSLEMIEAGAKELRDVVLTVPGVPERYLRDADRLYHEIITLGFDWQRSGEVENRARREDEEIRERTDRHLPKLPPVEVKKMIANIEREMLEVAGKREYERAAQLRDRVKELEEYLK